MQYQARLANIIFGGAILFCLGLLIYSFLRPTGAPLSDYSDVIPWILIGAVIVFSAGFKLPVAIRVNLALAILSFALTTYLIEIGFFLIKARPYHIPPPQMRLIEARRQDAPFDTRTRLQVVTDFREQGVEIYPRVSPRYFIEANGLAIGQKQLYPLGGISDRQTVHCNEMGQWIIFHSDEHGFRNPAGNYERQKIDVVLVGDSFTFGICVQENIGDRLRSDDLSVLNLGYSGKWPFAGIGRPD